MQLQAVPFFFIQSVVRTHTAIWSSLPFSLRQKGMKRRVQGTAFGGAVVYR